MANIAIKRIVQASRNAIESVDILIIGGAYEGKTITISGTAFAEFIKNQIGRLSIPDATIAQLERQKYAA